MTAANDGTRTDAILATHNAKAAERIMKQYRAHFCFDHWDTSDCYSYRRLPEILHNRSTQSTERLQQLAKIIQYYGYKIVISNANTENPKIGIRQI